MRKSWDVHHEKKSDRLRADHDSFVAHIRSVMVSLDELGR